MTRTLTSVTNEAIRCIPPVGVRVPTVIYAAGGGAEAAAVLQRTIGCTAVLMDSGAPYSRDAVTLLVGRRMQTRMVDGVRVGDGATSLAASHLLASAAWVKACACSSTAEQAQHLPVGAAATCTLSGIHSTRGHGDEAYVVVRHGASGRDVVEAHVRWAHKQQVCDRPEQSEVVSLVLLRALLAARGGDGSPLLDPAEQIAYGVEDVTWRTYRRTVSLPPDGQDAYLPAFGAEWVPLPRLDPASDYLYSGSFRPLHHAHLHNRTQMDLQLSRHGILQLSRNHPMKGPIEPARVQELAAAAYGVCDVLVGEDDGRYADKVARWGLDVALGTDVFPYISDADRQQVVAQGRKLLLIGRPGSMGLSTIASAAACDFPLVCLCPYDVSSTELRAHRDPSLAGST